MKKLQSLLATLTFITAVMLLSAGCAEQGHLAQPSGSATDTPTYSGASEPSAGTIEIKSTDTGLEDVRALTAHSGEKIQLKIDNIGTKTRKFQMIKPNGRTVTAIEVKPSENDSATVALPNSGVWSIKVSGGGLPQQQVPVTVS